MAYGLKEYRSPTHPSTPSLCVIKDKQFEKGDVRYGTRAPGLESQGRRSSDHDRKEYRGRTLFSTLSLCVMKDTELEKRDRI